MNIYLIQFGGFTLLVVLPHQQHHNNRRFFVSAELRMHHRDVPQHAAVCLSRNEEAGHYLSTYKQYESKPPDMIKERVDKDYNAILRNALTTINRVNKTDVETLRSNFGVCHSGYPFLPFD